MSEIDRLNRRLREYENLLEIGVELAGTLEIGRVLNLALEKAEQLCAAETSSIWELDEECGELFFRVVRGRVAGDIRDLRVRLGSGIVGSVALSGRAEIVSDVAGDERWKGDAASGFETRGIMAVPLKAHGRVVGVLQLLNPLDSASPDGTSPEFSDDDLRRMELFAGPLAHAIENARLYEAQKRQFLSTVTALSEAVEKRDPYTGGHIRRVVAYSLLLAQEMGVPPEELERLRLAAILHDIGKIAVPDRVLQKQGPLDESELEIMQRHPVDGAEIVAGIRELQPLLAGVRSHHERLDGKGYPDRLNDRQIPPMARVIAVADTFDAMTSDRPYRKGLDREIAAEEIVRCSRTQFCPLVVEAFERVYAGGRFLVEEGERLAASLFDAVDESYNPGRAE